MKNVFQKKKEVILYILHDSSFSAFSMHPKLPQLKCKQQSTVSGALVSRAPLDANCVSSPEISPIQVGSLCLGFLSRTPNTWSTSCRLRFAPLRQQPDGKRGPLTSTQRPPQQTTNLHWGHGQPPLRVSPPLPDRLLTGPELQPSPEGL